MPGQFLTTFDRKHLAGFPEEIPEDHLIKHFTLSRTDLLLVKDLRRDRNRLGFSVQLCAVRYLGFCPDNLSETPFPILEYVAGQLDTPASFELLEAYGNRGQTRTDHLNRINDYLGFRKASPEDLKDLENWLLERALEHDKPSFLFMLACERLFTEKILRLGVTILERMVISARQQAQDHIYKKLDFLLTDELKRFLDQILVPVDDLGQTALSWLRFGATSNTPAEILKTIEKLDFLKKHRISDWDLSMINPNRRKFMAQLGRRSTNQGLQRAVPQRRYPVLLAFLQRTYEEVIDELIELFDRCLADCYTRAKGDLKKFHLLIAKTTNEKLRMLRTVGQILLNPEVSGDELRARIYKFYPEEKFRMAIDECDSLIRPKEDHSYDFLGNRYSYIREFAPKFLESLGFESNQENDPLLVAVDILRNLNTTGKRKVPRDAPIGFIQKSWRPFIKDESGETVRRYYEISTLWHLRGALRSGDVWVKNSRRYANPESYLIPKEQWPAMRSEACRILGLPENPEERIRERKDELKKALQELDNKIVKKDGVCIENGELIVSRLRAEEQPVSVKKMQELIAHRLPRIDLTDLLIEVDNWIKFTDHFEHASTKQPRNPGLLTNLYASILAQANNHGLDKMAEISGLSYTQLSWCTNWYIREETLQKAINELVNYQFGQPLAHYWGGGTMSSSDGQRFPVSVKARNTTIIPKYYGYGRILTFYTWTSDQLSQWKCKTAPSTTRDATYVLDGMLDNETELPLYEHTTDTAGYTELIFAFFDLFGFMFSPRIRDLGNQNMYRYDKDIQYKKIDEILKGTINTQKVFKQWDTFLRIMASLKLGWVTASLFISKLQSQPKQSSLTKALQEYGRLVKSIYIPRYICREEQQRRVSLQLNKGEALHSLRQWLMFAEEGQIKKSQLQDQANQASALTLVTNAIIVWNTRYMQAVIDQLKKEGYHISDSDIAHISPCRFNHINKHGRYTFNVEKEQGRQGLRPLRNSKTP
jgi:TnpA family transposase